MSAIPRDQVMAHILTQCPPPANRSDWAGKQRNVDTCMRPLARALGYDGCPACLGSRLRVTGDPDSGACPTCRGTAVIPMDELP